MWRDAIGGLFIMLALVGFFFILAKAATVDNNRINACRARGYADCLSFGGERWCVRIEEGMLVGVLVEGK